MNLVVIDLIPALVSWEGRDRSGDPATAPNAAGALEHLASHFGLTGIADAGHTTEQLRSSLERDDLALYFESIGTCAEFGPTVSPRVMRRLATGLKVGVRDLIVVTARADVAATMNAARIRTVRTSHGEFESVDAAVEASLSGRVSP